MDSKVITTILAIFVSVIVTTMVVIPIINESNINVESYHNDLSFGDDGVMKADYIDDDVEITLSLTNDESGFKYYVNGIGYAAPTYGPLKIFVCDVGYLTAEKSSSNSGKFYTWDVENSITIIIDKVTSLIYTKSTKTLTVVGNDTYTHSVNWAFTMNKEGRYAFANYTAMNAAVISEQSINDGTWGVWTWTSLPFMPTTGGGSTGPGMAVFSKYGLNVVSELQGVSFTQTFTNLVNYDGSDVFYQNVHPTVKGTVINTEETGDATSTGGYILIDAKQTVVSDTYALWSTIPAILIVAMVGVALSMVIFRRDD